MMTPSTPFTPFAPFPLKLRPTQPVTTVTVPIDRAAPVPVPMAVVIEPPQSTPLSPTSPEPTRAMKLARAAQHGDTKAMRELLASLAPRVERVVRAVLGRASQDAEDVIQLAMLGFVQALPSFRGECEPIHFASRVAARTAIAAARRGRTTRARIEDDFDLEALTAASSDEPHADAERARRMEAMRAALSRIPAEQAETMLLRVALGWSLADVARTMNVPLNTVRSRLRLAKCALRTVIDEDATIHETLGDDE